MDEDRFETLHQLESGDEIRIYISDNTEVSGNALSTPYITTVSHVRKERLDHNKGDDVDGIVHRHEIFIEPHPDDDLHEQYVITTEASVLGEKSVTGIEARDWFEGRVGNGKYAMDSISFGEVELLNQ